ncbi:MAG TPA: SGNH/GDSL hydrolase family protein [Bryobacteraceae bacterium]|jgi:lysophospholipase L1-like esterase|nr:SGNH/GDSL hydrolase family protein [Bryobacteraceae bacterium]
MKDASAMQNAGFRPPSATNYRVLAGLYLFHLTVPALLLVDIVGASLRKAVGTRPVGSVAAVAAISALWLAAGIGWFLLSRDRQAFLRRIFAPLLTIYAVYFAVAILEIFLRTIGFTAPIPYARLPHTRVVSIADPKLTPGISGTKVFSTNALGLRGPMPPRFGHAYKIVAIGGSTTICTNLDDSEDWPHLLMEDMNSAEKTQRVWVGNAGISGNNTIHHLVLMQWLPGVLPVDMMIFLIGVNDLESSLAFEGASTQGFIEQQAGYQGELPPGELWRSVKIYPYYRRTKLFLLMEQAGERLRQRFRRGDGTRATKFDVAISPGDLAGRKRRAASKIVPPPDLSTALKEYHRRIVAMANQCRRLQVRCLFLTQPTIWRGGLSPEEQSLLWQGYAGPFLMPRGYLSPADLEQAMDSYNRTLLDVCGRYGLECLDIAPQIPKDTSAFFDDMHFNEAGSRLVARIVTKHLLATAPFSSNTR